MSERDHQAALFRFARMQEAVFPEWKMLLHVPNGAHLAGGKISGWKLKQEGVKNGVPDITLQVPRGRYAGLWIELKNDKPKGVVSVEQKAWIAALREHGYAATVCFGWLEARDVIERYLALDAARVAA